MFKTIKRTLIAAASAAALMAMPASAFTGTVTADILNVRTAPSTGSTIAGTLNWGDTVTVTYDCGAGWYEVYTNGNCYYVNSSYINSGSGSSSTTSTASAASTTTTASATTDTTAVDTSSTSSTTGTYLGNFALTAYCACSACCGSSTGITASGTTPVAGRTVAMDGVPFGTKLLINGNIYTVEDRGTSYGTVDIYCNTHAEACAFGLQYADVYQVY